MFKERKLRWVIALIVSLIANVILFTVARLYLPIAVPQINVKEDPIQIEVIQDDGMVANDDGSAGAPQIEVPKPKPVDIPPPPSQDEVQAIEAGTIPIEAAVQENIQQEESTQDPTPAALVPTSEAGGGQGNQSGQGSKHSGDGATHRAIKKNTFVPQIDVDGITNWAPSVQVYITEKGAVEEAILLSGTGSASADEVILAAVRAWTYIPRLENGAPMKDVQRVTLLLNQDAVVIE